MRDYEDDLRRRKPITEETREERVERMVNGTGHIMWRAAPGFKITDKQCNLAVGCRPVMTLDEIEDWIANRRRPK